MAPLTGSQRLAELLIGESLEAYLADKRLTGGRSYERIARDLAEDTNGEVAVSMNTIKRWLIDFGIVEEVAS